MLSHMASDPLSLGARIRRARERLHLTQPQLARGVGVSVRAVGDWENDRTKPKNRLGALEEYLGTSLTEATDGEIYTDPLERQIWEDPSLPEDEKRDLIAQLRRKRREHARRTENPPA